MTDPSTGSTGGSAEARGPSVELLTGWGRGSASSARVVHPRSPTDLASAVAEAAAHGPLLARGLGRSYGDAAQCAGGTVVDCTGLDRILDTGLANGLLRAESGVSLDAVLRRIVPRGWFLPVTPGTRQVTIGGAIAADAHGKNHHRSGAFGAHVERIVLHAPRARHEVGPAEHSDVFWATIGGMGLTGVIAEAVVRLQRIETAYMRVDTARAADLDECMDLLARGDEHHAYSVAWVDCSARGRHLGRAVVHHGDHASRSDLGADVRGDPLAYRARSRLSVPANVPVNLAGRGATLLGNELWYRKAPALRTGEIQTLAAFFYPLDAVTGWNHAYGPHGFTQYQLVVPPDCGSIVRRVIELLQARRVRTTLAVLKRFGEADPAPLSFPVPGWTLALDIPLAQRGIAGVLDEIDDMVADAGGRVYLAKDGRLRPQLLATMYPRLAEWRAVCDEIDPDGLLTSDLWRRVGSRPARTEPSSVRVRS